MEQQERGQRSGLRQEQDERERCCTADGRKTSPLALAVASSELTGSCYKDVFQAADLQGFRVIVHIDLDCFYAQVETMQHPEYRGMPLAVHQKHLVVTCNYEARRYGVNKMMSVSIARARCPDVILICGEDLTPYREASYQITELLEEFSPLVERLGFDENFVDVTELVEKRLQQIGSGVVPADLFVSGHIYGNQALNPADGKHVRLALGSKIGDELRGAIYERIGLTSSAGIAFNKLQAKLVSGTFKPNQQTTLLPESVLDCMGNIMHLKQVPGIGPKTVRRLEFHGVHTIHALQTFPLDLLEKELGVCAAQRIHKLSFGEDDYPVTPRGPPQSLSNEDSFRKCSSLVEIRKKLEELLIILLIRLQKDGRVPRTIRLTIRRSSATNQWFNRESRQCPVPNQFMPKLNTGTYELVPPLVDILIKLLQKMVDTRSLFFVSLLNVCFSNLMQPALSSPLKGSIGFYLTQKSPGKLDTSPNVKVKRQLFEQWKGSGDLGGATSPNVKVKRQLLEEWRGFGDLGDATSPLKKKRIFLQSASEDTNSSDSVQVFSNTDLPPGIDLNVFRELPANIQKEIITDASRSPDQQKYHSPQKQSIEKTPRKGRFSFRSLTEDQRKLLVPPDPESNLSVPGAVHCIATDFHSRTSAGPGNHLEARATPSPPPPCEVLQPAKTAPEAPTKQSSPPFPNNVDAKVFSQLPAELQKELLGEWKQQRTMSKVNVTKRDSKVKPSAGPRHSQKTPKSNSILNYFSKR